MKRKIQALPTPKEVAKIIQNKIKNNPNISNEEAQSYFDTLQTVKEHYKFNKLYYFSPFEYQKKFLESGSTHRYRFLCAANRLGKSYSAGYEIAVHCTGRYPDWWSGKRFNRPIKCWAVGITSSSVRDSLQQIIIGTNNAKSISDIGTGFIPLSDIKIESMEKDGAAVKTVLIKHYNSMGEYDGDTQLDFKSTQQGHMALAGATVDFILLDEEDPHQSMPIYTQCLTRTRTTKGQVVISATPENGKTELVSKFMDSPSSRMYFQQASVYECSLYSLEDIEQMKKELPPYQHGMRLYGDPSSAMGLIYPYDLESITVEAMEIPSHWRRVAAMDLGFDHPTTCIWSAYDEANDTIYVYGEYGKAEETPPIHANAISSRGSWIPVILPHDAMNNDRSSGVAAIDVYKKYLPSIQSETFYNFYTSEGKKNNSPEIGFEEIRTRMREGRIKIFSTCTNLLKQLRNYKMKDGKIHKVNDDYCDAFRYSVMSVINRGVANTGGGKWASDSGSYSSWRVNK